MIKQLIKENWRPVVSFIVVFGFIFAVIAFVGQAGSQGGLPAWRTK